MSIISSILSPRFLVENIDFFAIIISTIVLVIFDDYVSGKLIFPAVDKIKHFIFTKAKEKMSRQYHFIAKYSSEFLATFLFIVYFVFGYFILSEYVFAPIMRRLQNVLLIVIAVLFLIMSWAFNNKKIRKKYLYD
jgi:hypothetical protein